MLENPLYNPCSESDLLLGYPVYWRTRPISAFVNVVDFFWQPPGFEAVDMRDVQADSEVITFCYPGGQKDDFSWRFPDVLFYYPKKLGKSFRFWRAAIEQRNEFLLDRSKCQWTAKVWTGPTAECEAPPGIRNSWQDLPDRNHTTFNTQGPDDGFSGSSRFCQSGSYYGDPFSQGNIGTYVTMVSMPDSRSLYSGADAEGHPHLTYPSSSIRNHGPMPSGTPVSNASRESAPVIANGSQG